MRASSHKIFYLSKDLVFLPLLPWADPRDNTRFLSHRIPVRK